MARLSPIVFIPPALFGLLAGLFAAGMFRDDPDTLPSARAGQDAPALMLEPLGGAPLLTDGDLRGGQVTLVNFWASWCPPCRAEHPLLAELAAEGVTVHGINYKDDPAKAAAFLAELGNPYTHLGADRTGRNAIDWGVYGVPETYVIDGEGRILGRIAGPVTRQNMADTLRPLIASAGEQISQ